MAMKTSTSCIVSAMDSLWYHQIILWSDPLSPHVPNFVDTTLPFIKFPSCPSPSPLPFSSLMDETVLPSSSSSPSVSSDDISLVSQEDCNTDEDGDKQDEKSSKSTSLKFSEGRKLNKSTSCKSMGELELEEVKGFMDLGFEFKKENLNPQMVKLLPGLQRLRTQIHQQNLVVEEDEDDDDDDENDDDKKRDIARPYLSEAWPIMKRPNSPLLNLRVPKVSSTYDMKKQLKSWAKTVASQIQ